MTDEDSKGYINYEEFLRAPLGRKLILMDNNLNYAFIIFNLKDTDFLKRKK